MPALSELTLTLCRRRNEESGVVVTVFRFATVREFRSFRYEIQVEETLDEAARSIHFRIHGVHAPANLMPGAGPAAREIGFPGLHGEYRVTYAGASRSGGFGFVVDGEGIRLTDPPAGDELRIVLEKGIENVRA